MKLYIAMNMKDLQTGTVFHLREDCPQGPEGDMFELGPKEVEAYRKKAGIKRICLKCRKAARRTMGAGAEGTGIERPGKGRSARRFSK